MEEIRRARGGRERNNKLMEESNRNWKEYQDSVKKIKEKKYDGLALMTPQDTTPRTPLVN